VYGLLNESGGAGKYINGTANYSSTSGGGGGGTLINQSINQSVDQVINQYVDTAGTFNNQAVNDARYGSTTAVPCCVPPAVLSQTTKLQTPLIFPLR